MNAKTRFVAVVTASVMVAGAMMAKAVADTPVWSAPAQTQVLPRVIPQGTVSLYQEEDLSGPAFAEPVSAIVVTASAGSVCYADDKSKQDGNQYYVDCQDAFVAGAVIEPYLP